MCVWSSQTTVGAVWPTLLAEAITYIHWLVQTLPVVKFSITWVSRGQWGRNNSLVSRGDPGPTCTPVLLACLSELWLPVRKPHSQWQEPLFSTGAIFSAMSDIGILMNSQWQSSGREAACLPLHIYPQVLCTTGKEPRLWKQIGAGQKLISSQRLKTHLSKRSALIEADSAALYANGGVIRRGVAVVSRSEAEDAMSLCPITTVCFTVHPGALAQSARDKLSHMHTYSTHTHTHTSACAHLNTQDSRLHK